MSDSRIQSLARVVAANPADTNAADALAVALVRAGRGPSFVDYIASPTTRYGNWTGPQFGSYRLSIQAGDGKYSAPRRSGLTAGSYSEWEVAIVGPTGLVYVLDSPEFEGMPCADHWEGEGCVGPYVPFEGVQAIFDWLTRNVGRPQRPTVLALED